MRVLVTNDDGIEAPGLRALCTSLVDDGHDVEVVAPHTQQSGSAAGVGHLRTGMVIDVRRVEMAVPEVVGLAVDAPPALGILAAYRGLLGPIPDIVVSGINPGWNSGLLLIHSGTVGAALSASMAGLPAIAVSTGPEPIARFDTAAVVAAAAVPLWAERGHGRTLNLNVPALDLEELRGVGAGALGALSISDVELTPTSTGFAVTRIEHTEGFTEDSDAHLVASGRIAVTELHPPGPDHDPGLATAAAIASALDIEGP